MDRLAQLDDPAWNALRTGHAALAERDAAAMRYPAAMSPIAGLEVYTVEAFADLERLVPAGDAVGLVTRTAYELPADWEQLQTIPVAQMVCEAPPAAPEIVPVRLTEADVPEMLELVNATEPGPFRAGTIGMGRYFALKTPEGRLMAMAGERMRLDDFVEVSAVATWPEFRGRGLAKTLVSYVAALIAADGKTPFLHVKVDNAGAFALYEKLGFRQRAKLEFRVVRPRR